jgi:hypothetical protein
MAAYAEDTSVDSPRTLLDAHTATGATPGASWGPVSPATVNPIAIGPTTLSTEQSQ